MDDQVQGYSAEQAAAIFETNMSCFNLAFKAAEGCFLTSKTFAQNLKQWPGNKDIKKRTAEAVEGIYFMIRLVEWNIDGIHKNISSILSQDQKLDIIYARENIKMLLSAIINTTNSIRNYSAKTPASEVDDCFATMQEGFSFLSEFSKRLEL